ENHHGPPGNWTGIPQQRRDRRGRAVCQRGNTIGYLVGNPEPSRPWYEYGVLCQPPAERLRAFGTHVAIFVGLLALLGVVGQGEEGPAADHGECPGDPRADVCVSPSVVGMSRVGAERLDPPDDFMSEHCWRRLDPPPGMRVEIASAERAAGNPNQ